MPGAGRVLSEDADPVVDLFLEFILVDEAVDLHGAEEVADAFADAAFQDLLLGRPGLAFSTDGSLM